MARYATTALQSAGLRALLGLVSAADAVHAHHITDGCAADLKQKKTEQRSKQTRKGTPNKPTDEAPPLGYAGGSCDDWHSDGPDIWLGRARLVLREYSEALGSTQSPHDVIFSGPDVGAQAWAPYCAG